ncbi:MAG TPA: hypothetical protein VMG31_11220 [Verrucomicrobiae bacterium]|nr:hypothetical protein [Verrucomicrobiae bacterium]
MEELALDAVARGLATPLASIPRDLLLRIGKAARRQRFRHHHCLHEIAPNPQLIRP